MSIYIVKFKCKPMQNAPESKEFGGAYINCWIEATNIDKAFDLARDRVNETNWQILKTEDKFEIIRDDLANDPTGQKYYDQTLIDKWILNIHTYPKK
jgi:hypothetical protein